MRTGRALAVAGVTAALLWPASGQAQAAPTAPHYWVAELGLEQAWRLSQGSGVVVGLADTGVDPAEPSLAGAVLPGRAFPDIADAADGDGHGTAMAKLVAGRDAAGGIAPRARILPARILGGAAAADDGIRWLVDHGAKVINVSLGGAEDHEARAYDTALAYAKTHDVVVVAAAGNSTADHGVTAPASRPGVVAVSAVDRSGRFRPDVSVEGAEVALAAPGVDIDIDARPGAGTSYSAAIVSGVVALVRARFPQLSAQGTVDRILTTARDAGPPGRDPQYGFGVVDPVRALADPPPAAPLRSARPSRPPAAPLVSGAAVVLVAGSGAVLAIVRRRRRRAAARADQRPGAGQLGRR